MHELKKNEFNTVQLKIQSTKRNNSLGYSVGGYPLYMYYLKVLVFEYSLIDLYSALELCATL